MGLLIRLVATAAAAVVAAVATAIAVAVLDLYLTGHGYSSVMKEIITWEPGGVHLSLGDVVMLLAFAAAAGLTWRLSADRA